LVDTEPYWLAEQAALVHSFGGTWTHEDGLTLVGSGLWNSARVLQGRGVTMSEDAIVDLLTDRVLDRVREHLPFRPGAQGLLKQIRDAGIPTALVTMSIRRMAEHIAASVPFTGFDFVIAGDDPGHAKPHPDPYLRGASLLGVSAEDCVAIEDSNAGLASAVASGAVAVGVPLHSELKEGLGYTIWPTLEGRGLDDIVELFTANRAAVS
ncbi:MAG: family phosphatase, partial [Microbacteriaceae bacterium]|nr:family phosphatase [Microbacteriaceae bacterium]